MEHFTDDTARALIAALADAGEALERVVDLINQGRPHGAAVVASAALGKVIQAVENRAALNSLVLSGAGSSLPS